MYLVCYCSVSIKTPKQFLDEKMLILMQAKHYGILTINDRNATMEEELVLDLLERAHAAGFELVSTYRKEAQGALRLIFRRRT